MLNVAVSRAKDSFLVFGDMDVFETVSRGTPRARLADYLFRNEKNALQFECLPRRELITNKTGIKQLLDVKQHDDFLLEVISKTVREMHIVSPWIREGRIEEIGALKVMTAAIQRGVTIHLYTDAQLNTRSNMSIEEIYNKLHGIAAPLRKAGIQVYFVNRVHSKILICDENLYCVGSFNWFSASRQGQYVRHETSLVYQGSGLVREINTEKEYLQKRILAC